MPVCYCKNSGGYGRFLQVVEQKPVRQKVEEEQEAEPAKHLTKRKLHQLEPLKPSKRETRVRCVETGMEFETVKAAGSALAALGLGKDAAVAAWNKRVIDRDELLKIADELENKFFVVYDSHGEIDHADCFVERIMKAVDA